MSQINITVETGPNNTTVIRLNPGATEQAYTLDGATALQFGRAVISCGILAFTAPPNPAIGTRVVEAILPTMSWGTGIVDLTKEPVLVLEIPGTLKLAFQMSAQTARECGEKLVELGNAAAPKTPLN